MHHLFLPLLFAFMYIYSFISFFQGEEGVDSDLGNTTQKTDNGIALSSSLKNMMRGYIELLDIAADVAAFVAADTRDMLAADTATNLVCSPSF